MIDLPGTRARDYENHPGPLSTIEIHDDDTTIKIEISFIRR